jgi:hypothetical protein
MCSIIAQFFVREIVHDAQKLRHDMMAQLEREASSYQIDKNYRAMQEAWYTIFGQ